MKSFFLFVICLALISCRSGSAQGQRYTQDSATHYFFERVRAEYSGEQALETVAFLEQHWRHPGNAGFDASINYVAAQLELAGYLLEEDAGPEHRLTYRIEEYEMNGPAWEPVSASLTIVGQATPLLRFDTNRNMLAINSFSTPTGGVEAEVVFVGDGRQNEFDRIDVSGKIVFGEANLRTLFREAVQKRGAIGVLSYRMPSYTQPEINRHSIQFSSIPYDQDHRAWGLLLSYDASSMLKDALKNGPIRLHVSVESRIYPSVERTLVADAKGSTHPQERFVFSAHVQEPGANDNASGVAAQLEMARVVAKFIQSSELSLERTVTFIWGQEIRSTHRYIDQDDVRADNIKWGLSLDMVGENTELTGGTFLIEKMPDPSGIWTRGGEKHTEWGSR